MIKSRPNYVVIIIMLCFIGVSINGMSDVYSRTDSDERIEILIINSFHKGYKWSDDIQRAIEVIVDDSHFDVQMDTIYLDTQRISDSTPEEYYLNLSLALEKKYELFKPDILITTDDAAFYFVSKYCRFFSSDIPMFFCGLNDYNQVETVGDRNISGVYEYIDFKDTLEIIQKFKPDTETLYYIIDSSLTGINVEKSILDTYETLDTDIELIKLEDETMTMIAERTRKLPKNSAILFAMYFIDNNGQYYNYFEGIEKIANAAQVPVFGVWEYTLGHGVIGGKLLSGAEQGRIVANEVIKYLSDDQYQFQIIDTNTNKFMFDYNQLLKYDISLELLPPISDVINYSVEDKKEILIINSYNLDFQWTTQIMKGIEEGLTEYKGTYDIYYENMDLTKANNLQYKADYMRMFTNKHELRKFDIIITSDDGAFEFAKDFVDRGENTVPIVFCGVNYLEQDAIVGERNYTGVLESYDVSKTVDMILTLQPEVSRIYVINDTTQTGVGNRKNIDAIKNEYEMLQFEHSEEMTMNELQDKVSNFGSDTAILLMSYNRDRANNHFSFSESVRTLKEAASVPIYAVWDFYLGEGIVGGYLTDGYEQGKTAGQLGVEVLYGKDVSDIDIITSSPNSYKFDKAVMEEFGLSSKGLPKGSVFINEKTTFYDIYNKYSIIFNTLFILIAVILVVVLVLTYFLRYNVVKNKQIKKLATVDHLTGIYNRRTGIEKLTAIMKNPNNVGLEMTIYFIDVNNLKQVNDQFGHSEGDNLIITITEVIKSHLHHKNIFCRMGGDEFMIVIFGGESNRQIDFIINIKDHLIELTKNSLKEYEYSVSAGCNNFVIESDMNVNHAIEVADHEMYKDKEVYKKKANH